MGRGFGGAYPDNSSRRLRIILSAGMFSFFILACGVALLFFNQKGERPPAAKTVVVEKEPEIKMVTVFVPLRQIEMGEELMPLDFREERRPAVAAPKSAVRSAEELKGQYAKSMLLASQPIAREYLTSIRPINALTGNIPPGFRGVTIRVDAESGVEGWARPGAFVDVSWISQLNGKPYTSVLIERAKVLSAERTTSTQGSVAAQQIPTTITLLVNDVDAPRLHLASSTGKITLALRGDEELTANRSRGGISIDDMIRSKEPEADERLDVVVIDGQSWVMKKGRLVPEEKVRKNQ